MTPATRCSRARADDLAPLDPSRTVLTPKPDVEQGVALLDFLCRGAASPPASVGASGVLETPMFAEASAYTIAALTAITSYTVAQLFSGGVRHVCAEVVGDIVFFFPRPWYLVGMCLSWTTIRGWCAVLSPLLLSCDTNQFRRV
jgi:hypothetical protein